MDVSNKTLALFLIAAIVVSITGTFLSISRMGQFGITGYSLTPAGNVNLTITSNASIFFSTASIQWGGGYVTNGNNCTLTSVGGNTAACVNFSTVSTGLILENDGNVNVSLNLSSEDTDAATFIGSCNLGSPLYKWVFNNSEADSCNVTGFNWTIMSSVNASQIICSNFLPTDASDTIEIDFNVTFDSSCAKGTKNDVITVIATEN